MQSARLVPLEPSLQIRSITAPYFLAAKLEAFKNRGRRDYFASHDLEDILSIIDGRPEVLDEVHSASRVLRTYLAREFSALLMESDFIDALPAHLAPDEASQARIPMLIRKLEELARKSPR
jgi:hypothetical protein